MSAPERQKRDPLPSGDRRRLTDARCAWRKMDEQQRAAFLLWLKVEIDESGAGYAHVLVTATDWDSDAYEGGP